MKLFPILLLITVTVTYLFAAAPPQASTQKGTVQGIVTRDGTADPIPDVQITIGVMGGPGVITFTSPNGETLTMTPENGQQLLDLLARGAARGLPPEILDAAQQATRGNAPNGAPPPPPLTATTDASGRFTISGVPAGNVSIRAELQGYFGPPTNGNYLPIVTGNATVIADKPVDVHLNMIPGGTISGRVFDVAGKPLSDTPVQILRRGYTNGVSTLQTINLKSTDDHGEFRLYRLAPGEYFLAATPQRLPTTLINSTGKEVPTVTLYPGVLDTARAVPIVLRGGDDITGINIPIKTAATATISGKVIISVPVDMVNTAAIQRGAVPASVPTVTLARREDIGIDFGIGMGTSSFNPQDGTFQFKNVPSGSYVVLARLPMTMGNGWGPQAPPDRATGPMAFGRTDIVVKGDDVKDVAVVIHRGVDVPGRLFVDGKPSAAGVRISLNAYDNDLNINDGPFGNALNQIRVFNPTLDAVGAFTVPLIPEGKYRVQVTFGAAANVGARGAPAPAAPEAPALPATAYLADVRQAGGSVYDNGLNIGDHEVEPLEVLVNTNPGSIQGNVLGQDQKPVAATMVVLVPQENRRQNSALYKTARTDAQGHFTLNTIAPGTYTMFAWENVLAGAWQNAEFLRTYADRGAPVTVSAAERTSADVRLIKERP